MDATDVLPPFAQYIKDHTDRTIGRWFLGGMADFLLTGAFIASAAEYLARHSKHDGRGVKIFVLALLVGNIAKSIQTVYLVWYRVILNFGDYIGSAFATPTFGMLDPLFTQLLLVMGQAFFVVRLWQQTAKMRILRLVFIPMTLCIALGLCAYITMTVFVFTTNGSILGKTTYDRVANSAMGGVVAADLLITGLASYLMLKTRIGFKPSNSRRSNFVAFVWSTALLPLLSEVIKTVLYLSVFKTDSAYVIFHYMSAKLYSLSVIFVLSNRHVEPATSDDAVISPRKRGAGVQFADPLTSTMMYEAGEKSQTRGNVDLQSYEDWSTTFDFAPVQGQQRSTASAAA